MIQETIPGAIASRVISNNEIARNVFYLTFERPFDFEPGQVLSLTTTSSISPRLYSIASGVDDSYLAILFDVKPIGELSPRLSQLKAGDFVHISMPYGSFIATDEPAVWIATGTGVAPFISMAKSGNASNKMLVQGARSVEQLYFASLFETTNDLSYIRCTSQDEAANCYKGRLTSYLREAPSLPLNEKYYLCGNPLMVNEVRDLLIDKGIPFDNILSEIFF